MALKGSQYESVYESEDLNRKSFSLLLAAYGKSQDWAKPAPSTIWLLSMSNMIHDISFHTTWKQIWIFKVINAAYFVKFHGRKAFCSTSKLTDYLISIVGTVTHIKPSFNTLRFNATEQWNLFSISLVYHSKDIYNIVERSMTCNVISVHG